jgi:hypothetical protein
MHNFTVVIINGSYMSCLQSSDQLAIYVRNIKGNNIPVVYIHLKMTSVRYLSLDGFGGLVVSILATGT